MGRDQGTLNVHGFLPSSRVNGPGLRAVIWVQGCSLGCPDCFNPETHSPSGGTRVPADLVFQRLAGLQDQVQGVTISGGEPLQQGPGLLSLLHRLRQQTNLSVLLFTGYSWQEIQAMPQVQPLLDNVDLLIAGRYLASQRLAQGLRGSSNQTTHFLTSRYQAADLKPVPQAELTIGPDGQLTLSGIDPPRW